LPKTQTKINEGKAALKSSQAHGVSLLEQGHLLDGDLTVIPIIGRFEYHTRRTKTTLN
jgi:hypothetical protein